MASNRRGNPHRCSIAKAITLEDVIARYPGTVVGRLAALLALGILDGGCCFARVFSRIGKSPRNRPAS
jgi:hypothetical protein